MSFFAPLHMYAPLLQCHVSALPALRQEALQSVQSELESCVLS